MASRYKHELILKVSIVGESEGDGDEFVDDTIDLVQETLDGMGFKEVTVWLDACDSTRKR